MWKWWFILIFNVRKKNVWFSYYKVRQCSFAGFFDIIGITKCGKVVLLQSVTDCYYKVHQLLQSVTDCYYKVVMYYKVWQTLLQSASGITKCYSLQNETLSTMRRNTVGVIQIQLKKTTMINKISWFYDPFIIKK